MRSTLLLASLALVAATSGGCSDEPATKPVVVVRVAVDDIHARPILAQFEKETGIIVDAQYDNEQSKTVRHVTNIVAEQKAGNVTTDVFWNNEIVNTIHLKNQGMLEKYVPGGDAKDIPDTFKDPDTGFVSRARIVDSSFERS